jgi:hypothetical protein
MPPPVIYDFALPSYQRVHAAQRYSLEYFTDSRLSSLHGAGDSYLAPLRSQEPWGSPTESHATRLCQHHAMGTPAERMSSEHPRAGMRWLSRPHIGSE